MTFYKKIITTLMMLVTVGLLAACSSTQPKYNANKPLGPQINYTITGIDAGAGIMTSTDKALKVYGLADKNWQLQPSSTAAMTSTLKKAIADKRPIVVTGWTPHWMFTKFPLKFLKDPKNVYGKTEQIHTIVRKGLKQDDPQAYQVLDHFHWTPKEISSVMLAVNNGQDPANAAKDFVKKHAKQVAEWTKGVSHVSGHPKLTLTYIAWDSEIASTNVVATVLRQVGYKVTIRAMEPQPVWASVATKAADAQVSAWLPKTAAKLYADYKNQVVDLGVNMDGARVGLAVPKYMKNINSIEDLKK
ncbi:glycine/betaine ABC transporter [Lacticaseibacillus chiayiensis]|uniref:Glycine/betaine ABC transporter n=1 Tax=Lacticaseibacillus chiayiensis TaxID=2100821 RepID=A0A4Q1U6C4_9LACO|nr:glycine betaine ABC transporter substrate-binding protein [Lacticaseibacillus chiayiensis]QVI34016.1 glycine/betaine ABC transporter [Lacticaseibacillus chiayiensis]RXT26801.1 glycine/betaine ABC transporter [Lacticaseibacillus chiayiensis]RXT59104.1 glycine/betaine ABC transporter [Lacticaseibacillus chiayiensis]UYN55791.1 glycine/betaine ABC transporter [Lacticaseibacillus chiayiensis]